MAENPKCKKCGHRKSSHGGTIPSCMQCYNFLRKHAFVPIPEGEHHRACASRVCRVCGLGPRKGHASGDVPFQDGGRVDHFMERGECDCR